MSGHLNSADARSDSGAAGVPRIRVMVADGHPSMRRALKRLLEEDEDMEVVGEAGDFESAVEQARACRPQVLVFDVRMPGAAGLDSIRELRAHVPGTGLVLITMENNPAFAKRALDSGGLGVVRKDAAETELSEAVRRAARGDGFRSSRVTDS